MSIEKVKAQCEDQLMALPNVVGVAIGEKAGKPVIQVLVSRKVAKDKLGADELVPRRLSGYATDVVDVGNVTAQGAASP